MIIFVRTASVSAGKMGEALAFANEISAYMKKHYGVAPGVMLPVGGNPNRIAWRAEYEGLGQLDQIMGKTMADADYRAMITKNAHLFIEGSVEDAIWHKL